MICMLSIPCTLQQIWLGNTVIWAANCLWNCFWIRGRPVVWIFFPFCSLLPFRRKLLFFPSEWVSVTKEAEPSTNSANFDPLFPVVFYRNVASLHVRAQRGYSIFYVLNEIKLRQQLGATAPIVVSDFAHALGCSCVELTYRVWSVQVLLLSTSPRPLLSTVNQCEICLSSRGVGAHGWVLGFASCQCSLHLGLPIVEALGCLRHPTSTSVLILCG